MMQVVTLSAEDTPEIVDVFCDAFHAYPVMRYVLGESPDYDRRLTRLIHLFVMGRVMRDEPIRGIASDGALCAAATMSYPERQEDTPAGFTELREAAWRELGLEARQRYDRCTSAWSPLAVNVPQLHLNMIGVRRSMHGQKAGRMLLTEVVSVSKSTPGSQGISLTTELPRNVELYQHMGYEVTGHVNVTPDLETWALFHRH